MIAGPVVAVVASVIEAKKRCFPPVKISIGKLVWKMNSFSFKATCACPRKLAVRDIAPFTICDDKIKSLVGL